MRLHGEEVDITTVAQLVRDRAAEGDREFLRIGEGMLSYREADLLSTRMGNALAALGAGKGTVVSTLLYNSIEAVLIWFGCAKLGAIWNPVNVSLATDDLAYTLNDSAASILVMEEEFIPLLEKTRPQLQRAPQILVYGNDEKALASGMRTAAELAGGSDSEIQTEVTLADPMAIIYTGGSTGMPKGVLVPHLHYIAAAMRQREVARATADDVMYESGHLFHGAGEQLGVTGPMFCKMRSIMTRWFSVSRFWETLRANEVTVMHAPGTMLGPILNLPPSDLDRAHRVRVGLGIATGMIRRSVRDEFERRFNVPLLEVWAQTEMGVLLCSERLDQRRPGSSGHSNGWAEVRAVDENDSPLPPGQIGELVTRASEPYTFMLGYHNKAEEMVRTWRNLWHHTGDLGYIDEDGFVYFVGRQAHWIRRRSENVAAFEIEKAITSHPDVDECAAVGVESSIGDEEIKVYVQLRDGSPGLAPEEIVTWATERIAYFKVPRYVEFVPDLPRTAAKNEIKRQELKARGIGTAWDRDVAMPDWR